MRFLVLSILLSSCIGVSSARQIGLKEAIDLALEQNLGLMIANEDRAIADEDVIVSEAEFDIDLSLNTSFDERLSAGAGDTLEGAAQPESQSNNNNLRISKRFKTGTQITQTTNLNSRSTNSQFRLVDTDYTGNFQVELRQPLLNGRGKAVNLAAMRSAESQQAESDLQWRNSVLEVIVETEELYWDLAYAHQREANLQTTLKVAEQLLEEAEKNQKLGAGTRLETLQARTALANRQSESILAIQEIQAASDALRRAIGELDLDSKTLETTNLNSNGSYNAEVEQLYSDVLDWSLEARIQEEVIKQRELDQKAARNRVAPRLDLALTGSYLGRDDRGTLALQGALERDGYYWRSGLEFSMPWGLRSEKAQLQKSKHALRREEFRLKEIQKDILLDAREAHRNFEAAERKITVTELTVSLNEEQFDQERRRHEAGGSTFRNVLEAQEDLDEARTNYLEALRDANKALARIQSMDGSLLDRHGFTWESVIEISQ